MNNTRALTRTAILAAMNIVFLILGQILRTNTLSFLVLASFLTGIAIVYISFRYSIYLYTITTVIAFIFIPDKSVAIVYMLIFGNYGIVKVLVERLRNNYSQFTIKTTYFIVVFYISYILVGEGLINLDSLSSKYDFPVFIFIILFALLFNIYDYLYSAVINFVYKKTRMKRD